MSKLSELSKINIKTPLATAYDSLLDVEDVGLIRTSEVVAELASRSLRRFRQQISAHESKVIIVTANGGILPEDDNYIEISGPSGDVFHGNGPTQCTFDRSEVPNKILLGQDPPGPTNYNLKFWI